MTIDFEQLRIGNVSIETSRGKQFSYNEDGYRLGKDSISFPVYENSTSTALVSISCPFLDQEKTGASMKRQGPIKVTLNQFGGYQKSRDEYYLDRKHLGEVYGGQPWLHRRMIGDGEWKIVDDEPGDLAKYREAIEKAWYEVPSGKDFQSIDDVLSFIDGMYKAND